MVNQTAKSVLRRPGRGAYVRASGGGKPDFCRRRTDISRNSIENKIIKKYTRRITYLRATFDDIGQGYLPTTRGRRAGLPIIITINRKRRRRRCGVRFRSNLQREKIIQR